MTTQIKIPADSRLQELERLESIIAINHRRFIYLSSLATGLILGTIIGFLARAVTQESPSAGSLAVLIISCVVGLGLGLVAILARINGAHADIRAAIICFQMDLQPSDSDQAKAKS